MQICICNNSDVLAAWPCFALINIGSGNGMVLYRNQAITWTNGDFKITGEFGEIWIKMQICVWKCCLQNGKPFVHLSVC